MTRITERHESVNLHNGEKAITLLHISDIHLWYSTSVLQTLEKIIEKDPPDLIVMTGDYYDIPAGAHKFRKFLLTISSRISVAFILGNHDHLYGRKVAQLLSNIPNCFLVDNSVFVFKSKHGHTYNITSWKNRTELPSNENERNIVLMHNPEKIRTDKLSNIHLIFAGHLHGGQFIFFKTKNQSHFPGNLVYRYCTDRKLIGNTTLIVSKGLGDTLPLRWNCNKEVVKIKIT